jgi:uncharacterized protein YbbC (DUF1343 family)
MQRFNLYIILIILLISSTFNCCRGSNTATKVVTGAEQLSEYLPDIENRKVGLIVNQTSIVDGSHLVDLLLSKGIQVKKIFTPEHGFRGDVEAGDSVNNSIDKKTGIPIISLYGKNKKPTKENLSGIDVIIFDIQDVGCRFFTYISTMHYAMEACAENNIPLIILDRPNPNGDYVDGPVLKPELKSFVGMHPIPIVHGCTVGELALMINGEGWLDGNLRCNLKVVPVKNYKHSDRYELSVKPSPNLPNQASIRLYPSLCLFEATTVSIGRGTEFPFQVIGFPNIRFGDFIFTPQSIKGVSAKPLHEGKQCFGIDLRKESFDQKFTLSYFIQFFNKFENPDSFWSSKRWIDLLSGDPNFYSQINEKRSESEIRQSWQTDLLKYKTMRKKYLLYPDFE